MRKFGESLRSKTDRAMKNKALAKVEAHNLCCVTEVMTQLGVSPRMAGLTDCTQNQPVAH